MIIAHSNQLSRLRYRQVLQQRGMNQGKDRGVGTDSQTQRQQSGDSESGAFAQHAQTVAHILQKSSDREECARLSLPLVQYCRVTELTARRENRIFPAHALANKFFCQQFEVHPHFTVELGVGSLLSEKTAYSRRKSENPGSHCYFCPSRRKTRPITLEIRSRF